MRAVPFWQPGLGVGGAGGGHGQNLGVRAQPPGGRAGCWGGWRSSTQPCVCAQPLCHGDGSKNETSSAAPCALRPVLGAGKIARSQGSASKCLGLCHGAALSCISLQIPGLLLFWPGRGPGGLLLWSSAGQSQQLPPHGLPQGNPSTWPQNSARGKVRGVRGHGAAHGDTRSPLLHSSNPTPRLSPRTGTVDSAQSAQSWPGVAVGLPPQPQQGVKGGELPSATSHAPWS